MHNIFKKIFCMKLGLSELLVEYEKVLVSLRENELVKILIHMERNRFITSQISLC